MSVWHYVVGALAAGLVIGILYVLWQAMTATCDEASRKLGRELTNWEGIFAMMVILSLPMGVLLVLTYVWCVMPEPKEQSQ